MAGPVCKDCALQLGRRVACGAGRSHVYGEDAGECLRFDDAADAFDARIRGWIALPNSTADNPIYEGCRDALEVLFCAQEEVHNAAGSASACSSYRRPFRANVHQCLAFCPAIRDACPASAFAYCEERCRADFVGDAYCAVLQVDGLHSSRWPDDTLDIMNKYRLEVSPALSSAKFGWRRARYRALRAPHTSLPPWRSGRRHLSGHTRRQTRRNSGRPNATSPRRLTLAKSERQPSSPPPRLPSMDDVMTTCRQHPPLARARATPQAEQKRAILRNGRPYYRSVPARRPAGSSRVNKLDYYMYATRVRGFDEWLLDTNDIDTDGAQAHVSDANLLPYRINSDWSIFNHKREEWIGEPLRITCLDGLVRGAAAPTAVHGHAPWGVALAALASLVVLGAPRRVLVGPHRARARATRR